MPSISRRSTVEGKPRYLAQVRILHVSQSRTFRRKADARQWAADVEKLARLGTLDAVRQAELRTFGDVIRKFCDEELCFYTFKGQKQRYQQLHWWLTAIGDVHLCNLDADRISTARALLKHRGNGTVNKYMDILRRVLNLAVKSWRWLEYNPMTPVVNLPAPRGRTRWLADRERAALLFHCQKVQCRALYPIIVLTLSTGPRKQEIRKIRWTDYDQDRHRIYLADTKNGESRSVLLFGLAREIMQRLYDERDLKHKYVFEGNWGRPLDIEYAWTQARQRAGLDDFHFHDLRHSTASYLAQQGANSIEIMEILGLKTIAMVKRYAHMSRLVTEQSVEKMNRRLF